MFYSKTSQKPFDKTVFRLLGKKRIIPQIMSKIIFFLFLTAFFGLFCTTEVSAKEASLLFSPETVAVNMGEEFTVEVILDTVGEQVGGAGAKITFKNTDLTVIAVKPGSLFYDYPSAAFSNEEGKIIISGVASSMANFFAGQGVFATITFQAKSPGTSLIQFIYQPGSTTDSNIAVTYGSGDILSKVNSTTVTVGNKGIYIPSVTKRGGISDLPAIISTALNMLEKLGISAESFAIFASKVFGKGDTGEAVSLKEPKEVLDQNQPEVGKDSFSTTKLSLEKPLLVLIIVSLILIPVVWLIYTFFRKRQAKNTKVVTKL